MLASVRRSACIPAPPEGSDAANVSTRGGKPGSLSGMGDGFRKARGDVKTRVADLRLVLLDGDEPFLRMGKNITSRFLAIASLAINVARNALAHADAEGDAVEPRPAPQPHHFLDPGALRDGDVDAGGVRAQPVMIVVAVARGLAPPETEA